jgi:hypothetical protein
MGKYSRLPRALFSTIIVVIIYVIGSTFSTGLIEGFSVSLLVFIAALIIINSKSKAKPLKLTPAENGSRRMERIAVGCFMVMLPIHKMLSSGNKRCNKKCYKYLFCSKSSSPDTSSRLFIFINL